MLSTAMATLAARSTVADYPGNVWSVERDDATADQRYRRAFGTHLAALRLRAGLTQAGLARLMPTTTSSQQISRWETGTWAPNRASQRALARALGVSMNELLRFDIPDED